MMCNYNTLLNQGITEGTAAPINMFPKYKFNDTDPKTNAAIYPAYHKGGSFTNRQYLVCLLRAATDESQKTRNKKQNGLAHSRFIVCVTPKQKKNIA